MGDTATTEHAVQIKYERGQQIGIDIGNNGFIVISWDNFVMCNL